jgi:hypothetical protein
LTSERARQEVARGLELASGIVAFLLFSRLTQSLNGLTGDLIQYVGSLVFAILVVRLLEVALGFPAVEITWFAGRSDVPLAGPHFDCAVTNARPGVFVPLRISKHPPGSLIRWMLGKWTEVPLVLDVAFTRPLDCDVVIEDATGVSVAGLANQPGIRVDLGCLGGSGDLADVRIEIRATRPDSAITIPVKVSVAVQGTGRRFSRVRVRSAIKEVRLHPE